MDERKEMIEKLLVICHNSQLQNMELKIENLILKHLQKSEGHN
jgi:hypothetical protein